MFPYVSQVRDGEYKKAEIERADLTTSSDNIIWDVDQYKLVCVLLSNIVYDHITCYDQETFTFINVLLSLFVSVTFPHIIITYLSYGMYLFSYKI